MRCRRAAIFRHRQCDSRRDDGAVRRRRQFDGAVRHAGGVRQPRRRLPAQDRRHARQQQLRRGLVQRHLPQRSDLPGDVLHRIGRECGESGGRRFRQHDSARTGGNTYTYEFLGTFSNNSLQAETFDDELRARGFNPSSGGDHLWDANGNVGGPILRDKLWFFGSGRYWGFAENVPNVYWGQSDPRVIPPGAEQASDDTDLKSVDVRLTTQLRNTHVTGAYSNGPRWRRHFGIENRGGAPESFAQYPNDASVTQIKSTRP